MQQWEYKQSQYTSQVDHDTNGTNSYYNNTSHYSGSSHNTPPSMNNGDNRSADRISEITTNQQWPIGNSSIMGGRKEQHQLWTRNHNIHRSASSTMSYEPLPNTIGNNEADTNADTFCLRKNFIPLHFTNKPGSISCWNLQKHWWSRQMLPLLLHTYSYERASRRFYKTLLESLAYCTYWLSKHWVFQFLFFYIYLQR